MSTPSAIYRKLFNLLKPHKITLIMGDLNAHHYTWNARRTLSSFLEEYKFSIMNDDRNTLVTPPGAFPSITDLVMADELMALCKTDTLGDLEGSNHLPIKTAIQDEYQLLRKFSYKIKMNEGQLSYMAGSLHATFASSVSSEK